MQLHGSILENLERAIASARRLRGERVYSDTLTYWRSLVDEGLREQARTSGATSASLEAVIATLKSELVGRVGETQTP